MEHVRNLFDLNQTDCFHTWTPDSVHKIMPSCLHVLMFAKVPFFNRSTQQEMICFKCDLSAGSILWGSGEDAAWVESAGVITRDVHSKPPVYYLCCSHYWFNWASCRLCIGIRERWRLTALDICVLIFMRVWYFPLMYICGSPLRSKLQNQIQFFFFCFFFVTHYIYSAAEMLQSTKYAFAYYLYFREL